VQENVLAFGAKLIAALRVGATINEKLLAGFDRIKTALCVAAYALTVLIPSCKITRDSNADSRAVP